MATIDAALETPSASGTPETDTPEADAPHAAPGVDAPTPLSDVAKKKGLTADEKRAYDVERQQKKDLLSEEEAEAERQRQQAEAERSTFEKLADTTTSALGKVWRGTSARLESIPTPGSILFPLIVLLVFFFLLLPVNGHTRLVWFWLCLAGNADIQVGASVPPDTSSSSNGSTPPAAASAPITPPSPGYGFAPGELRTQPVRTMTGVEGAS
jgi:hypothetical protein